jgi:hypothetical protein
MTRMADTAETTETADIVETVGIDKLSFHMS